MATKKPKSQKRHEQTQSARNMAVCKRDDMVQRARMRLSLREQKCVLYATSRIRPTDSIFCDYVFDIKDFYDLCGLSDESYTELKAVLKELRDKSWWVTLEDGTESAVSWFSTVRTNRRSGKVTVKFHEDMMPYLLQLAKQHEEQGIFYTQYGLRYVLPMRGQYSPRLYEILKSYQKNNREWFFDLDELKRVLDAQSYVRWPDFRRRVLEPAVAEINQYTDLNVLCTTEKVGKKVVRVLFSMARKQEEDLRRLNLDIDHMLDGQISFEDIFADPEANRRSIFWRENQPKPSEGGSERSK